MKKNNENNEKYFAMKKKNIQPNQGAKHKFLFKTGKGVLDTLVLCG